MQRKTLFYMIKEITFCFGSQTGFGNYEFMNYILGEIYIRDFLFRATIFFAREKDNNLFQGLQI